MTPWDGAERHRLALNNAITHLLWHDDARRQVGLEGISQIWGEDPAWYFWLHQVAGAFLLRIVACEQVGEDSVATFLLHHFPPAASDPGEQAFLDSPFFDRATGTPVYEHREKACGLFIAGEIGIVLGTDGALRIAYGSWRQENAPAAGELFNLLIGAGIFFHRRPPIAVFEAVAAPALTSRFVTFEVADFLAGFLPRIGAGDLLLQPATPASVPTLWHSLAGSDAPCTAAGVCDCAHH